MGKDIITRNNLLPDNLKDLTRFVLVGREKLTAVRAEIRAIEKIGLAKDVREQKRDEAQLLAGALLDAEARIGELIKDLPSPAGSKIGNRGVTKTLPEGITHKQSHFFRALAANRDVIEQVKAEAMENDDLPTRTEVLRRIKQNEVEEKREDKKKEEPAIKKSSYKVSPGDTWKCGKHIVICADCYSLIDTLKAAALITDPPYGIDYKPDWNKWDGRKSDFNSIIGDDKEFNPAPFMNFNTVLLFGANYFSNLLPIGGWLCWDKRTKEEIDTMFGSPFELAWYRSIHTTRKSIMVRVQHGGVINADSSFGNNEKRYHATQKPIVLMKEIIEKITEEGETIIDPFAGSGSTLLACNKANRNCIAVEIDPGNVSIILQRYKDETGEKPCLE